MQELAKSHDTSTRLQVTNVLTGGGSLSYERYMLSNEDEGLMKLIQGQPHLIFFTVSAVFETYFGISMLLSVYADERSSFLYSKCMGYGRTTAGVCGLLLLVFCFLSNHTGAMLVAALTQHPNGIGSLATAVAWLLFAFGATARNRAYWLGFVSNGLCICICICICIGLRICICICICITGLRADMADRAAHVSRACMQMAYRAARKHCR